MITYTNLREEQFMDWIALCVECFSKDEAHKEKMKNYFIRHYNNDENSQYQDIFIAMEQNHIIGSVRVFKRWMYLEGQEVPFLGIGEVCTDVHYRGRGIIRELFKRIFENYPDGYAFYMLSTDIFPFYEQFGFEKLALPYKEIEICQKKDKDVGLLSKDSSLLATLYRKNQKNGSLIRSDFYFSHWVKDELPEKIYLFGQEEYLSVAIYEGQTFIYEYLGQDHFDELISSAISSCKERIIIPEQIRTSFPVLARKEEGHWMFRLIKPFQIKDQWINNQKQLMQYLKTSLVWTFSTDNY